MKKTFEYIGLFVFVIFSFYYTEKVVKLVNDNDPLMEKISLYADETNRACVEGYTTEDGIILGVSGLIVDEDKSYSNMKGFGYSEELFVFEEDLCSVNKSEYIDEYIIKGNESKNAVSLLILVDDAKLVSEINGIAKAKGVNFGYVVSGEVLKENEELFAKLLDDGNDILYGGTNEDDFETFYKIIDELGNNTYCIYNGEDVISYCSKENVNSVKTDFVYNKNVLLNVKSTLEKGNIYIIKENKYVIDELSSTISHINGKGISIYTLTNLLS